MARAALEALPALPPARKTKYLLSVRDAVAAAVWRALDSDMRIDFEE